MFRAFQENKEFPSIEKYNEAVSKLIGGIFVMGCADEDDIRYGPIKVRIFETEVAYRKRMFGKKYIVYDAISLDFNHIELHYRKRKN
jgi:hypothetical protein